MRINVKSIFKSRHDLILIISAMIAVAMIISKMVHNWRTLPPSLGMNHAAIVVADSRVAPR
jgi:hypothetical protein